MKDGHGLDENSSSGTDERGQGSNHILKVQFPGITGRCEITEID